MTFPLKLSITALAFEGVLLVAYEGDRRRVHFSLVDPAESTSPADSSFSPLTGGGLYGPRPVISRVRLLKVLQYRSEIGQR